MKRVIEKSFTGLAEQENSLCETLFHNANGYIGVRGSLEEGTPQGFDTMRGTYINGFYDVIPMKQAENLCNFVDKKDTMLNVVDTMSVSIDIEGEVFDLTKGTLITYSRTLDMDEGVTKRHVIWRSPKGHTVRIDFKRMTSFEKLTLFLQEVEVEALDFDGKVTLKSEHIAKVSNYCNPNDPRLAAESIENLRVVRMEVENEISCAESETSVSNLTVCSLVYHEYATSVGENGNGQLPVSVKVCCGGTTSAYIMSSSLCSGQSVTLKKYTIISDSLRTSDVVKTAKDDLQEVISKGSEYYYRCQKEYLADFWRRSEMTIYGDDAMNRSVAFNMYELLQSAGKDNKCSIAAKGLSGEGYEGHYFWDTETFILPFFILTNPKLAREILSYRHQTVDKAKENARLLGHKKGALYPWRTIAGAECSGYFVSGSCAYHINADIAYAVISYYLTTGDLDFIEEKGEEILIETARLWMDLGCYDRDGRFVLNDVTGPDEYTCMVNNNYYTNCAAQYNMLWAVKLFHELDKCNRAEELKSRLEVSEEELAEISVAATKMFLPYDERLGINPQDDSFLNKPIWDIEVTPKSDFPLLLHYHPLHLYRYQVCKQADTVLAYFMFEDKQSIEVMRKSYEYYEKITTHDSSLSTCVFSIVASRLGMCDKGYDYFGDSAKLDLENTHNNTKDGIHTANMGGCYMAIVNGFAGLRITEKGLKITPFVPKEWEGYRFNVVYRDRLIRINVNSDEVKAELLEGEPIEIDIYQTAYLLDKEVSVGMSAPKEADYND